MGNLAELSENLDIEYWFDREGYDYRSTRGHNGLQLNIKHCPFCGNSNWKVYLNADNGLGNCFVCDTKFNKPKLIKQTLDLSWQGVEEHMREVLREQGWRPKQTRTVDVDENTVKLPPSFELPTPDGRNLKYLEGRNITGELAAYFHLRYCTEGLWLYKFNGGSFAQDFSDRLIIPVYDLDGKLTTFQGRDIYGSADKKYLFPSALPGTGRFLYNGQNAVKRKRVVMGEGAFDVFALKAALDEDPALRDVVPIGSFGKHLSYGDLDGNDQLGRFVALKRDGLEEVTIMWDGEYEALKAACEASKLLIGIGLKARIALLPPDRDPNEVSPDVVRAAFYSAVPYSSRQEVLWSLRPPYLPKKNQSLLT